MGNSVSGVTIPSPVDAIIQKGISLKNEDLCLNKIIDAEKSNFSKYRTEGTKIVTEIITLLQKSGKVSVARPCVAGSIGKRSALGSGQTPDFDIVIFLNVPFEKPTDIQNAMKEKQAAFKKVLDASKGYKTRIGKIALGVTTSAGTELDVVPAVSFHKSHWGGSPIESQWKTVLEIEYHQGSNLSWLCSSLAEKVVEYVAAQPGFVTRVVILAKMWNQNVVGDDVGYVPGRSTIVELVAVKAAQEEIQRVGGSATKGSPMLALLRVLGVFAQPIDQVRVVFEDVRFPIETATQKFNKLKKARGILLDPVNPYNNYLQDEEGRVRRAWPKFRKAAQASLQDVEKYFEENMANIKLIEKIVYGETASCCSIV